MLVANAPAVIGCSLLVRTFHIGKCLGVLLVYLEAYIWKLNAKFKPSELNMLAHKLFNVSYISSSN